MIDDLQDKRIDSLEQRLVLLEAMVLEVKGMLKVARALLIGVAGVLGVNLHQIVV